MARIETKCGEASWRARCTGCLGALVLVAQLACGSPLSNDVGAALAPVSSRVVAVASASAASSGEIATQGPRSPDGWRSLAWVDLSKREGPWDPTEFPQLSAMALDGHSVFVGQRNGALVRIPKAGGPPVRLKASGGKNDIWISDLAVDATHVYWTGYKWDEGESIVGATVLRVAKTGGAVERIGYTPGGTMSGAALGSEHVYYLDLARYTDATHTLHIWGVPKSGGTMTSFALPQHRASAVVADGEALFVSTYDMKNKPVEQIFRLDPGTSTFSALGAGGSRAMAIDEVYVYWANDGEVLRMDKRGGVAEKLCSAPFGVAMVQDLVVDETSVYWTASRGGPAPASYVSKVPKLGGAVVSLASENGQYNVSALAVDGQALYWMTPGSVRIRAK